MKHSSLYAMVMLALGALLFALCLNPAESFSFFPFKRKKAYNIRKFLDTKEPIWTYTTSRRANIWCEVGVTDNVTENSVFFKRSSYDRKGRTSAILEGKLSDRKKHMDIDGVYTMQEDIIYMSRNGSCAVIMESNQRSTYESRIHRSRGDLQRNARKISASTKVKDKIFTNRSASAYSLAVSRAEETLIRV
ncbi:uncharacterized protein LOC119374449 isoform X3 [Rhipicephalus sanguineus]|uniref:uncharacterized protein LOC119374449 isoform X3 n=1 Tax=Rhipicephalus sanguineus TaxID=34632 RepID=UPI00189462B1|nr:uncharacterized protein LOC119374449 isoform X3 [Rhipicephalus sanguineus]